MGLEIDRDRFQAADYENFRERLGDCLLALETLLDCDDFGDAAHPDARLTISADIDRHNFESLPAGAPIGWVQSGMAWPLDARRADGSECSREMFRVNAGVLETCHDFMPIMMTTKPEIAKSDCLFYAARESSAVR